jgi:hypothetical protein
MKHPGDTITLTVYRIEGLENLTVQDKVPKGDIIDFSVKLQIPGQST